MGKFEPTVFVRKPIYVEAVRVTEENMLEVAVWCASPIMIPNGPSTSPSVRSKKYIKVPVKRPLYERQTMGFIGDWILKNEDGYRVYTDLAFRKAFVESPKTIEEIVVTFVESPKAIGAALVSALTNREPEDLVE